jgi:hypothetical protein
MPSHLSPQAIDFAKDQNDNDLWEDLLKYSETRPRELLAPFLYPSLQPCAAFIRGLLENVGAEINPIRLIRRIKNGLEIPGLKPALIKILQDFNLQISLLEGCQAILHGDSSDLARQLHRDQTSGFLVTCKRLRTFFCAAVAAHERYQQKHSVRYAISLYRSRRRPSSYFSYVVMPFTLAMWTVVMSSLRPLTQ